MKFIFPIFYVLFPLLICGCCNFYPQVGNGVSSRSDWTEWLPAKNPAQVEAVREAATSSDVTLYFDRGAYGGYAAKLYRTFDWNIPVGPYRERSFWKPGDKTDGRSLCITLDCWGTTIMPFLVGLFTAGNAAVYDYSSGDCIAYERFMRAGIIPLVAYESSLMPVTYGRLIPGCPNTMSPDSLCSIVTSLDGVNQEGMSTCYSWPTSSLNRVSYNRLTSYYFLCGLFAFGQKNDRAYMQLAWIPIPMWSMQ